MQQQIVQFVGTKLPSEAKFYKFQRSQGD